MNVCVLRYYSCDNPNCMERYTSIYKDSVLEDVGVEYHKFLYFLLLLVAQVNNSMIQSLTGHSSSTLHKYRNIVLKAVIYDMEHNADGVFEHNMIGGPGVEIQVDESKFGVSTC